MEPSGQLDTMPWTTWRWYYGTRSKAVQAMDSNGGMLNVENSLVLAIITLYLKSDGTVLASGWNKMGALGDGSNQLGPSKWSVLVVLSNGNPINGVIGISAP